MVVMLVRLWERNSPCKGATSQLMVLCNCQEPSSSPYWRYSWAIIARPLVAHRRAELPLRIGRNYSDDPEKSCAHGSMDDWETHWKLGPCPASRLEFKSPKICRPTWSDGETLSFLRWVHWAACRSLGNDAEFERSFKFKWRLDANEMIQPCQFQVAMTQSALQRRGRKYLRTVQPCGFSVVSLHI